MRAFFMLSLLQFFPQAKQPDPAAVLSARALSYLHAEAARKKADPCGSAASTVDMRSCVAVEFKKTTTNYLGMTRALGALLRLPEDGTKAASSPQPILFDEAEKAWLTYRDMTCATVQQNYSTLGTVIFSDCQLSLTASHMIELRQTYSGFFQ